MKLLVLLLFSMNAFATEKILGYEKWPNSPEKRVLNLYTGFRDGATAPDWKATKNDELVLYINSQSAVIERRAEQIDFQEVVNLPDLGRLLDSFANVSEIRSEDLSINKKAIYKYRIPPTQNWCASKTLCLNLDFKLNTKVKVGMVARYLTSHLNAQSDVRAFKGSEIDPSTVADIKALTGLSTPPTSMIVQNIFWFDHVMEYGKVLAVVQADPSDPQRSIVNGYVLFSIERKWWDNKSFFNSYPLSEVFLGHQQQATWGILQGLPRIVERVFTSLTDMIRH